MRSHHNKKGDRIEGGVYIANKNGLRGDIIPIDGGNERERRGGDHSSSSWGTDQKYVVKLRGSGIEIPVDKRELVQLNKSKSSNNNNNNNNKTINTINERISNKPTLPLTEEQIATKQEEDIRYHLTKLGEESDEIYVEDRVITMEIGDEFTYTLVSNTIEEEKEQGEGGNGVMPSSAPLPSPVPQTLPADVEGNLLVRLLEGYFVGQGNVVTNGRHLNTYKRSLSPFYTEQSIGKFGYMKGSTSDEMFHQLHEIFNNEKSYNAGLLIFKAFGYAHHRFDYHNSQQDQDDYLLDAYCVVFYIIKLLQGTMIFPGNNDDDHDNNNKNSNSNNSNRQNSNNINTIDYASLVNRDLDAFGSGVEMTVDDLVWCFCILFLRLGTNVRRYIKPNNNYNKIFPKPFDLSMNEELYACQLAIELRPDSPVSFLPAYRMIIETKNLIPKPFQNDWMKTAYDFAERGLETAERWGDPYYQYMFEMVIAYWIPTTILEPNPYTLGQIESQINLANDLKKECLRIVPKYMFWMGEKHELSLRQMLRTHQPIDRETELTVALVDAFTYEPLHLKKKKTPQATTSINNIPRSPRPPQKKKLDASPLLSRRNMMFMNSKTGSESSIHTICFHCSKSIERRFKCSHCKKSHLCSRECQAEHWQGCHQNDDGDAATVGSTSSNRSNRSRNSRKKGGMGGILGGGEKTINEAGSCGCCSKPLQKALMCSKCTKVGYCDRDCQVKHWKSGHKQTCKT